MLRSGHRKSKCAIVGERERTARIRPAKVFTAEIGYKGIDLVVDRCKPDAGGSVILILEVNAVAVLAPNWRVDFPSQLFREELTTRAIAIHDVEMQGLITLMLIVKSHISDLLAVSRDSWLRVRAFSIG